MLLGFYAAALVPRHRSGSSVRTARARAAGTRRRPGLGTGSRAARRPAPRRFCARQARPASGTVLAAEPGSSSPHPSPHLTDTKCPQSSGLSQSRFHICEWFPSLHTADGFQSRRWCSDEPEPLHDLHVIEPIAPARCRVDDTARKGHACMCALAGVCARGVLCEPGV